jgi:hypothetical protein
MALPSFYGRPERGPADAGVKAEACSAWRIVYLASAIVPPSNTRAR